MAKRSSRRVGALIFVTLGLLGAAGLIGWAIGHETTATRTVTVGAATTAPVDHSGGSPRA